METGTATFTLQVGEEKIQCEIEMPAVPVHITDMLPILHAVGTMIVDQAKREAVEAGGQISCRAGCGACCRQPVPLSVPEARRLLAVIGAMEPDRRAKVVERFKKAIEAMEAAGMLERIRGIQALDVIGRRDTSIAYHALGIACPFLEEESCSIYEDRPMACREYHVVSPAEHCKNPTPEKIRMVRLRQPPSSAFYRLGDGSAPAEARFLIMTLMGEWAESLPAEEEPVVSYQILHTFLTALATLPPPPMPKQEGQQPQ